MAYGAPGVSGAFSSPTGGIIFALEEASSFWRLELTWRTYLSTMLATFTVWLADGAMTSSVWTSSTLKFGAFNSPRLWQLREIPYFLIIATGSGLLGAAFCETNLRLSRWRRERVLGKRWLRMAEALACTALTVFLGYLLPALPASMGGGCVPVVPNPQCNAADNK